MTKKITYQIIIWFLSTSLANAQSNLQKQGFYVGGLVGISQISDLDFDIDSYFDSKIDYELEKGYNIGAQFGYKFGNGFRIDLGLNHSRIEGQYDINYRWTPTSGLEEIEHISNTSLLMNGYYDFTNKSRFTPYLGASLGISYIKGNSIEISSYTGPGCYSDSLSSSVEICVDPAPHQPYIGKNNNDTSLTYGLMTGLNFDINSNFTIGLEYKYLSAINTNFSSIDFDYHNHNIDLKLLYHF